MWGLILKDFYNLSRQARFVLIYLGIFGVAFMGSGGGSFISSMMVVMVTMLSISTFTYDDAAKWDRYALTTPLSRKKIVMAKYLMVLLLVLMGAAFGAVVNLGSLLLHPEGNLFESMVALAASSLLGTTITALTIPFIYKFGTEKSRLITLVIFAAPTLGIMGLQRILPGEGFAPDTLEGIFQAAIIVAPLLCVAVICFSYVVSVRIFMKKEV